MPIYMDLHILPGVKARDVAEAHRRDMLIQNDHRCNCMTYWIDEKRGNVFCLIEAPDQSAVEEMHRHAHGLIPNRVIEVNDMLVESFLGRISDPEDAVVAEDGLKIFADPSLRILLVAKMDDPVLVHHRLGREKAIEALQGQKQLFRDELAAWGGNEAEHYGNIFIASFTSASKAIACARNFQKNVSNLIHDIPQARIAIHAGEPVTDDQRLFGETIKKAMRMCMIAAGDQILLSSAVKELIAKDSLHQDANNIQTLSPHDESLLDQLFNALEENWHNPDFSMTDYRLRVAMSPSQLYRKTITLTGISPNSLLKEYRLEKARELMRNLPNNITQTAFDSGFTSPSYFTKCFKKKYGMLPMTYLDMLH